MNNSVGQYPPEIQNENTESNGGGFHAGANWFYWIAGLSIINSISVYTGQDWVFVIGLGITQLADSVAMQLAEIYPEDGDYFRRLSLVVDLLASAVFVIFGWLANKKNSVAYLLGICLYLGDGLIFLLAEDWMSIGFHLFALFFMVGGYLALRSLLENESETQSRQPHRGLSSPVLWINMAMILTVAIISLGMMSYTAPPSVVNEITNFDELGAYTTFYYKTKNAEFISSSMEFLDESDLLADPSTHSTVIGFYSEVFKQNPDKIGLWIETIDQMQNKSSQLAFWKALWLSGLRPGTDYLQAKIQTEEGDVRDGLVTLLAEEVPVLRDQMPRTPEENDAQWFAFFASGDTAFVNNIISAALLYNQRFDRELFYTAATAKWSLADNALTHDLVMQALVVAQEQSAGGEKAIIQDIIDKSKMPNGPQLIIEDLQSVVAAEIAAGRWQE